MELLITLATELLAPLVIIFALALLVEGGIEFLLGTPFDKIPKLTPWKWLLMYFAIGASIGLCLFYKLDIIALLAKFLGKPETVPTSQVGMVLTGILIGRGSNVVHDFITKFFVKKDLPPKNGQGINWNLTSGVAKVTPPTD